MNYKIAYALGFHPWEVAEKQPSFNERFMQLLEREERGRQPPYGRALDIGTGSGIWGIKLAERGTRARARADSAFRGRDAPAASRRDGSTSRRRGL